MHVELKPIQLRIFSDENTIWALPIFYWIGVAYLVDGATSQEAARRCVDSYKIENRLCREVPTSKRIVIDALQVANQFFAEEYSEYGDTTLIRVGRTGCANSCLTAFGIRAHAVTKAWMEEQGGDTEFLCRQPSSMA